MVQRNRQLPVCREQQLRQFYNKTALEHLCVKSMNALFLCIYGQRTGKQLLDKLSRSSNKNEGGHLMYSKNGIRWVRPPTHDRKHRENNIGRTEQWSMN